jgi:hypothetical protein
MRKQKKTWKKVLKKKNGVIDRQTEEAKKKNCQWNKERKNDSGSIQKFYLSKLQCWWHDKGYSFCVNKHVYEFVVKSNVDDIYWWFFLQCTFCQTKM